MKNTKLTPKAKKIIDISVTVLQIVIVLIAIIVSAIVIANPITDSAEVSGGKTKLLPVLSGSMDGENKDSFKAGDLVIAKTPKNQRTLEVGQIITFVGDVNGRDGLITHRIVEVILDDEGLANTYITRGDANPIDMTETVNPYNVLAVYSSHLNGVGKAINWLQQPTNFLLVIVIPLVLLFIYNIIMFVRMLMQAKLAKVAETAGGEAIDEEAIKRKAIEEYLASQNMGNKEVSDKIAEDETEKTDDND